MTGDRQREKTEDTPMPRACGCRALSVAPAGSLSVLRAPFPSLSLSLSPYLPPFVAARAVHPRHFLSPLFAFFPLAVLLVLAFPLLRARPLPHRVSSFPPASIRFAVVLSSRSLRRAFSLTPPPLYIFSLRFPSRAVPPFCSVSSVSFSAFTSSTCRSTSSSPPSAPRAIARGTAFSSL